MFFPNYGYIEQIFLIKKFLFNASIYSSFTVKGFVSFGGTQLVWNLALSISYKSPIGLVKLQPIIPSLKKVHWLFVLMLVPNITIVSGFLPHSSLDSHLGDFVYNMCFEWNLKITGPQDVKLSCGLNLIFAFFFEEALLRLQQ